MRSKGGDWMSLWLRYSSPPLSSSVESGNGSGTSIVLSRNGLEKWAAMSHILECMLAWNSSYVANTCEEDEADTTIASLGPFVTPSTPRVTSSGLLLFLQLLHASSLSRASASSMFSSSRERSPKVERSGEVTLVPPEHQ